MSLQFCRATDYFLVMSKIRSSRLTAGFRRSLGTFLGMAAMALGVGCDERERLTFPTPIDGIGPDTRIDQPERRDTTISPGATFFVNGTTSDPDGVDTVYFFVIGANQGFPPIIPDPTRTSVRFGLPLTTAGHSGETWEVQIHGVDELGNQGDTTTRQIHIQ